VFLQIFCFFGSFSEEKHILLRDFATGDGENVEMLAQLIASLPNVKIILLVHVL
jgi:hypothetical protein